MKRMIILLSLGILLSISCSEKESIPFPVSKISFTPCRQEILKSSELSDKVDVAFTDEGVQVSYYNFEVPCDFTDVSVTHTFENGVLNITQQGSPDQANCICYTDVSYTIEGIKQNEVNVIFINGVQVYCYNENMPLQGTKWKLVGIGSLNKIALQELEPKDCEKCYTLTFGTDSTFQAFSSTNGLHGTYKADYLAQTIKIIDFGGTKINEIGDGILYVNPFWQMTINSFSLQENELRLHYNDNDNYLLFKPCKK